MLIVGAQDLVPRAEVEAPQPPVPSRGPRNKLSPQDFSLSLTHAMLTDMFFHQARPSFTSRICLPKIAQARPSSPARCQAYTSLYKLVPDYSAGQAEPAQ